MSASTDSRSRRRRLAVALAAGSVAGEAAVLRRRGYGFGGTVTARCREGHLFDTIWIPGASIKSLRLGPWRYQRCPVGGHLSVVTPVHRSRLSKAQLAAAEAQRDMRVP